MKKQVLFFRLFYFLFKKKHFPFISFLDVAQTSDLSNKVNAGANYLGSFFSSAWTKTTKTANDATTSSSTFLSTALGKVGGSTANSSAGKWY